jgi:hypothetical protein
LILQHERRLRIDYTLTNWLTLRLAEDRHPPDVVSIVDLWQTKIRRSSEVVVTKPRRRNALRISDSQNSIPAALSNSLATLNRAYQAQAVVLLFWYLISFVPANAECSRRADPAPQVR